MGHGEVPTLKFGAILNQLQPRLAAQRPAAAVAAEAAQAGFEPRCDARCSLDVACGIVLYCIVWNNSSNHRGKHEPAVVGAACQQAGFKPRCDARLPLDVVWVGSAFQARSYGYTHRY